MERKGKLTPRTDLRMKRLAYFDKVATSPNLHDENIKAEELRKSMTMDPRVRPKSAVQDRRVSTDSKKRPSSAAGKHTSYSTSSNEFIPSVNKGRSEDFVLFQPGRKQIGRSEEKPLSNDLLNVANIKVNSWLGKKSEKEMAISTAPAKDSFPFNYFSQKSDKTEIKQVNETRKDTSTSPRNSFSSFLEAQYEEDYSVLALSEDMKKSGNQGFFLEDSQWSQSLSKKQELTSKGNASKSKNQNSREDILRESLEHVVKEEARQNGRSEMDKENVEKKVSAMFDTLDPSNLETILGKERYERLIKNFEESEEMVDGVSSATGMGWLKDSSEDSQIDTSNSHKDTEDNVIDTLSTHRSDPLRHNIEPNIQIEISEPYKDYDEQLGSKSEFKQKSAFDLIMDGEGSRTHPAEAALISLMNGGKNEVSCLPVVPDPFSKQQNDNRKGYDDRNSAEVLDFKARNDDFSYHNVKRSDCTRSPVRRTSIEKPKVAYTIDEIYKEADKFSDVGSYLKTSSQTEKFLGNKHNYQDKLTTKTANGNCNQSIDEHTGTLRDYDKRLSKSGVFSSNELNGKALRSENYDNEIPNKSVNNLSTNGEQFTNSRLHHREEISKRGSTGLLAKASLDTTTDMFRNTFDIVKEANGAHGTDRAKDSPIVSHLRTEDHVEGIKQYIEIRKREKAEMVGELPTNPALERYFSSVENLHVHKDGNGSVISSEGFEPVPEPDIHDTPGRGLILGGKSALKHNTIQKSGSKTKLRGKSPPKPTSGRRSRDFAPSSSRSYKNATSPKFRENVRSTSQKSAKDTQLYDYENTEVTVTFNSSRLDDTKFEETSNKKPSTSYDPDSLKRLSTQQSQLLRDALKERDDTEGRKSNEWDDLDDDDLLTRVTSMADGMDGVLTERIKKLNIELDVLSAERKGNSVIQSPKALKKADNRRPKSLSSGQNATVNGIEHITVASDDMETCVETEIGTDLGTDFVNTFFKKNQELKEKQKLKEDAIRKSIANHAFPVINDSEDDFTVVSALKSSHGKSQYNDTVQFHRPDIVGKPAKSYGSKDAKLNKLVGLSTTDDEDSSADFNVFRKSRQRSKSKAEEEEDTFNKEFEVTKSIDLKDENKSTVSGAKHFFGEVDAKYKSSTKKPYQEHPQQMVKACPECGEVNKVYVTWCVECGGVLSEVKPVPFLPKKSHTPREVAERMVKPDLSSLSSSVAQESFKIKLENSFNEPRRGTIKNRKADNGVRISGEQESNGTGNIRDSDNFEYEQMESPVRSLPDPLKRALSLDLQASTDSSAVSSSTTSGVPAAQGAVERKTLDSSKNRKKSGRDRPGVHKELVRMSENIDFMYNEAESPKKSFPHALQQELSLELSLDSDSSTFHRINAAAKETSEKEKSEKMGEKQNISSAPERVDVSTETVREDVPAEVEAAVEYRGVGPSGDATDSFQEFISQLRKDPRFNVTTKAKPSSSTPQLSKSKARPQSASTRPRPSSAVKSKVRSSMETPQYERKWTTSSQTWSSITKSGDLRASSSLGLKSITRPASAKVGGRPSSAVSKSIGPGGDASKGRATKTPQSATTKPRLVESGDFGIVGKPTEVEEEALKTGRTAILTVTSATASKSKVLRKRNVFETYNKYIAMKDNPEEFQSPRIAIGEYSAWLCLPDELWLLIMEYLSHKDLAHLAQTCSQINRIAMDDSLWRNIVLRKSNAVNDDWLINIGRREPNRLSLIQCHGDHVTPHGMRELFRQCSESLQELRFTGCNRGQLTGDNILLHAASRCHNITHLDASWTNVNDNGVAGVAEASDKLEVVNFSGCQTLTDEAVSALLMKHGIYLREVELFGCFNLTSKTATALANHCKGLTTLNVGQLWKLSDTNISQLSGSLGLIETLNVSGCKQMKDTGVHRIVQNCPKLKSLALTNCPTITDTSMGEVATYCSQIRSLDVSGCKNIGNNGIRMLGMACQQLEFLDVSSTACTHKAITSLANYCNRRLEVLKVNFCKNITEQSLVKLATQCRRLKKIYIYGVNGIRGVDEIKCAKPDLWIEQ